MDGVLYVNSKYLKRQQYAEGWSILSHDHAVVNTRQVMIYRKLYIDRVNGLASGQVDLF